MYAVFDLLGKFHFVSLSSYFNTNPTPTPSYQHTSRSLIVKGCPCRGGAENMITSRRFLSKSFASFFGAPGLSFAFAAEETGTRIKNRTENGRIRNFVMGNGLQELAARNVLSKRSVFFKASEPRPPSPPPLSSSQKQQIRSTLLVFSEIIHSCTGGITQTREEK